MKFEYCGLSFTVGLLTFGALAIRNASSSTLSVLLKGQASRRRYSWSELSPAKSVSTKEDLKQKFTYPDAEMGVATTFDR